MHINQSVNAENRGSFFPVFTINLCWARFTKVMQGTHCLMPHSHCKLQQLKVNHVSEYGLLIGQSNKSSHLIG